MTYSLYYEDFRIFTANTYEPQAWQTKKNSLITYWSDLV